MGLIPVVRELGRLRSGRRLGRATGRQGSSVSGVYPTALPWQELSVHHLAHECVTERVTTRGIDHQDVMLDGFPE